ncbi:helicase HerA-like domain-containing protein [Streptococcus halotolerans]
MLNCYGIITGAIGISNTVSLTVLAESLRFAAVPAFFE